MKFDEIKAEACCASGKAVTMPEDKNRCEGGEDSFESLPMASCCPSPGIDSGVTLASSSDMSDEPCCGPPPSAQSSVYEKPGYTICRFVADFLDTPVGVVPRVKTEMGFNDFLGTIRARSGLGRNDYKVAPGLYAIGNPDMESSVLVSANYKLSFDKLRTRLKNTDAWILVIDTRGINVWCAGGKNLFSAEEIVRLVRQSGLSRVVSHRKLILPQLAANGVSARSVKKGCGFEVVWGPVRADDIEAFIANRMKATDRMRLVTFDTRERMTLIPVELNFVLKASLWVIAAAFILSGIGPGVFSVSDAVSRGSMVIAAYFMGVFTGAILTPALLPWIPVRAFSVKGLIAGLAGIVPLIFVFRGQVGELEVFTLLFVALAVSSFLAMNFTGSTPYTSPSGVEKEMRVSMPFQAGAVVVGVFLWVVAAFGI